MYSLQTLPASLLIQEDETAAPVFHLHTSVLPHLSHLLTAEESRLLRTLSEFPLKMASIKNEVLRNRPL